MKRALLILSAFLVYLLVSWYFEFQLGVDMLNSFTDFSISLIQIVPLAFVLIGLFDVWIKNETVEKHLGEGSRFRGYFWAIILASTSVGGLFVALPVAAALSKKGARAGIVFTYLAAATVCRIPMTVFEATFVGVKFTVIRFLVSLPLIIIASEIMAKALPGFSIKEK